jgi:hypothetical protein
VHILPVKVNFQKDAYLAASGVRAPASRVGRIIPDLSVSISVSVFLPEFADFLIHMNYGNGEAIQILRSHAALY